MAWDLDEREFYDTFTELQESEGSQRALEWAWSALDWTQQELKKERVESKSAAIKERAAVVAYLRRGMDCGQHAVAFVADHIERGEHRREEEG